MDLHLHLRRRALEISDMKKSSCSLLLLAVFIAMTVPLRAESWVPEYGRLLDKYVAPNGVKYAEWKSDAADLQALQKVVDGIAAENVSSLGKKEQLAYYL